MRAATAARLGAAAVTGTLLAAARPPLDVGPLACVAFVPLFVAWRGSSVRATVGYTFVAAVVYYAMLMSWTWYFGAIAIVPLVIILATYWAAAGAILAWLRGRGVANPFLIASVWVLAEATVARVPFGGFSWGEVGYAFHNIELGRALASDGGVELVTFFAVALNGLLADAVANAWNRQSVLPVAWVRVAAGLALVVGVPIVADAVRSPPHPDGTLRVAVVQGEDIDRDLTAAEVADRYLPKTHFQLAAEIHDRVDLVIFPESSMDADPRTDPYLRSNIVAIARRTHAWVLANAVANAPAAGRQPAGAKALNLDVLFAPDGTVEGTYAKRHLVPFGEYVPFRAELEGHISELNRIPRDFEPGHSPGIFEIAGHKVATIICFESAFGYQVRPLVHAGAQVIVVSTNNRSYERSANSAQHVAIGQMRAAETGRPLVQAAISGISAIIDANGVVQQHTALFQRTLLEATVTATTGETPYVRYGEWAIWACAFASVGAAGFALQRGRRSRFIDSLPRAADEPTSVGSRIAGDETVVAYRPALDGNLTSDTASESETSGDSA
ncbi:MAG: apolipoprotein N-acyltransferase [Acidimicrobiia bacterium]